jgi:hypothetical protein
LRIYDAVPGKLPALHHRFANITNGFFEKHGIKPIAYWTDLIGVSNRLSYIVVFDDLAQRERAWAGFQADEERIRAFAETEKDGPLVARVENKIMQPTQYSPLQ